MTPMQAAFLATGTILPLFMLLVMASLMSVRMDLRNRLVDFFTRSISDERLQAMLSAIDDEGLPHRRVRVLDRSETGRRKRGADVSYTLTVVGVRTTGGGSDLYWRKRGEYPITEPTPFMEPWTTEIEGIPAHQYRDQNAIGIRREFFTRGKTETVRIRGRMIWPPRAMGRVPIPEPAEPERNIAPPPSKIRILDLEVDTPRCLRKLADQARTRPRLEPPASDPEADLSARITNLESRWSAYDTDLSAILDRPLLRDLSDPRVIRVIRARSSVRRAPDDRAAVDEFSDAMDAAERAADARGAQALPADEREHVERARDLLRVIESAASSEAERALAYDRLRAAVARMGHLAIAPEKLPLLLPAGTVHTLGRSFDPRRTVARVHQEA